MVKLKNPLISSSAHHHISSYANLLINTSAHLLILLFISSSLYSQSPQKMSYQAVIRNTSNVLVANHAVGIRISILQGSPTGTEVYKETYSPVPQTNANGLVTLEIGSGVPVTGIFSNIDWSAGPYFLKTETDPNGGTAYTITGTSQLLSVPYAFYTNSAGNGFASSYSAGEKRPVLNLTDGNLGFDTPTDPWFKLNVNGIVNITPGSKSSWGANLSLDASSQAGGLAYTILSLSNGAGEGGGKFLIKNNSASSTFVMDNNGHTGINKYNPSYNFDVTGDINFTGSLLRNGNSFITPQGSIKVKPSEANMDSALFEVRNTTGQVIFAVYNEGVRIYVDDGVAKTGTTKGGFAIGSFDKSKGTSQTLFIVDPDSIRAYIDTGLVKTTKGGFAIGSFDRSKAGRQQFLRVTQDSIRMYINDAPTKAVKGGFAIGGFDKSKGISTQYLRVTHDSTRIITADTLKGFGVSNLASGNTLGYLRLTPSNYFIGHQAGKSITTGLYNSVIGYQSGYKINTGISNSFIGYKAGYTNSSGNYNVFLGNEAGYSNIDGSMNTFIGYISGRKNTTGFYNSFLGDSSGYSNTQGYDNTFIGARTGYSSTSGSFNSFLGFEAGLGNLDGNYNTFIGGRAGTQNTSGNSNFMGGYIAGQHNTLGTENVYLGSAAGFSNTTGSYNVIVGTKAGAGSMNGSNNLMVGYRAGYNAVFGDRNTFIGNYSGPSSITDCSGNVFIGYQAGSNEGGSNKLYIANSSTNPPLIYGNFLTGLVGIGTLSPNVKLNTVVSANSESMILGTPSGGFKVGSVNNLHGLLIGVGSSGNAWIQVGRTDGTATAYNLVLQSAGGNVGIGTSTPNANLSLGSTTGRKMFIYDDGGGANEIGGGFGSDMAGYTAETDIFFGNNAGNGRLIIGAWTATQTYVTKMTILANGNMGLGTSNPGYKLTVNGTTWCTSGAWTGSDIRWKKNITPMTNALTDLLKLNPVNYDLRTDEFPEMSFESVRQIGLIAQDVESILPELVKTDDKGYKAVSYEKLSVVLVEGVKEQQKQIVGQQQQIESQQKEIDELKALVNSLVANQPVQGNK